MGPRASEPSTSLGTQSAKWHPGLWIRRVTSILSTWEETSWRRCLQKHWAKWETSETSGCLGIQFAGWGRMLFIHWRGRWKSSTWITWDWRRYVWIYFYVESNYFFHKPFKFITFWILSHIRCRRTPWQAWAQDWGVSSWRAISWRRCPTSTLSLLWRSSTWLTILWCVTALCCHYACKTSIAHKLGVVEVSKAFSLGVFYIKIFYFFTVSKTILHQSTICFKAHKSRYTHFSSKSRWIEKVNLKVRATCANPPELRGRRVKDVHIFKACPGGEGLPSAPTVTPKLTKVPKPTKPKPKHLSGLQVKMLKAKSKLRRSPNKKQAAAKKRATKRHTMAWIRCLLHWCFETKPSIIV